jgi:hypothetical protein
MKKLIVAVLMAAGALAFAPMAHADTSSDQAFLLGLKLFHVPTDGMSNNELLNEGHAVCVFLQQPHTFFAEVGLQLMKMHPDWTVADAGHFAGSATGAWCPSLGPSSEN